MYWHIIFLNKNKLKRIKTHRSSIIFFSLLHQIIFCNFLAYRINPLVVKGENKLQRIYEQVVVSKYKE